MSTITASQHRTIKFRASIIADKARSLLAAVRSEGLGAEDLRMISSEIVAMNNDLQLLHADAQRAAQALISNEAPALAIRPSADPTEEVEITEASHV